MDIAFIVGVAFIFEILELAWQYSPTLYGSLQKAYRIYKKSIFLFFAMHINFLWILYISLKFNLLNFPILIALGMKVMDIFVKLDLIKRLFIDTKKSSKEYEKILTQKVPIWLYFTSPLFYPFMIYLAFDAGRF
ncbi:MAG: hypothetical protein GXO02_04710 [Epsilonproteobacteria bacterium]|jgi:hypothetical protein|nr:hypothetical protein [Campylobacterota bacterium]